MRVSNSVNARGRKRVSPVDCIETVVDPQRTMLTPLAMHESGGWLAAVAPADARRFRVSDADIAHSLREAGAALVEHDADVEIGWPDEISGDAPCAIVGLNLNISDSRGRVGQATRRLAMSGEVRARAACARVALRRRGYRHVQVLPWDRDQLIRLPGIVKSRPRNLAERFPRRVVLVASKERPGKTAFEQALLEARIRTSSPLKIVRPIVASGSLIVVLNDSVLRVAVGPASRQIDIQAEAFKALHAGGSSEIISGRVPQLLALGRAGLARWSLERRLPGVPAPRALRQSLLNECIDFLVALYGVRPDGTRSISTAMQQADILSAFVPGQASALDELGCRIDEAVGDLRSGFGHGDFWPNNLLVRDEQLLAVIDWEQAGSRRLPLLDLFHLRLLVTSQPQVHEWGPALVRYLVPFARRGGDVVTRDYLKRIGLEVSHRQLKHLVAAYWLDFVSRQLGTFFDRQRDPLWIDRNVKQVVAPLLGMLSRPGLA